MTHIDPAAAPDAETTAMQRALDLAGRGVRGANPLVGSVILDEQQRVIGTGYHQGAGTPHAEIAALADARTQRADLTGCTLVCTLEPCSHAGRTGPCTQAIVAAGIARVVFAAHDDHGPASGGGSWLRTHGVDTVGGLLADEAQLLNHRWRAATSSRRPFITLKTAQTLDGRVAATDGTSQWITGPESRSDGHAIRRRADAVLVGTGTVLADDPRLSARHADGTNAVRQPLRVAMGLRAVPDDAAIRAGNFVQLATRDPWEVVKRLYDDGVGHLMIEGGPTIATAFLAAGLVDELFIYQAPLLLGTGTPAIQGLGIGSLQDASRWELDPHGGAAISQCGSDVRLHLSPVPADDGPSTPAPPKSSHRTITSSKGTSTCSQE
ncbi:bifunctional diaminohydroxyphosphoribosylaminopyrimidine deaminase/5-amino-6-(5-phosphoribosylamino)uracil reductase RibD [Arthrobacter sp. 260]|uniref:bifunctional diaminohydroxyphosphoribosylaminopyrimidine deaminase/5-amino-6-(5-phosphoribosylamino)uracil reductase RibD n=1 Tax=Arthrobacter sp. 260 TaxID=2735314 RepID=UPI001492DA31|nr:bifunctional diaminohydroxyphosphoribosylaminopyrimidine deaminase/5-amino-6-(5-phosphoribosylamino)uracil reductase RibD [Arthrobacter sp. 260]NOJ61216.1 bifunctional diaminohydroxyphosphoribosylaminopyrimidine deaminase/5-amino-6-(5-phosphoribosylamino)uracil reductase RibD [Arthrobacter sp. 260]